MMTIETCFHLCALAAKQALPLDESAALSVRAIRENLTASDLRTEYARLDAKYPRDIAIDAEIARLLASAPADLKDVAKSATSIASLIGDQPDQFQDMLDTILEDFDIDERLEPYTNLTIAELEDTDPERLAAQAEFRLEHCLKKLGRDLIED